MLRIALLLSMLACWSASGLAQEARLIPVQAPTQQEITQELIGASVFSSDGHEVGSVLAVLGEDDGDVDAVRLQAASYLGLGGRVYEVPARLLILLRGAVVLDFPAESLELLEPYRSGGHHGAR